MVGESRTGCARKGFDELQVVRRRDDRDVPHVGGQVGQLRLHIESGAVPSEERVDGESVAKIVHAWESTGGGPNAGPPEQCSHGETEAATAVAAAGVRTAMPEERAVRSGWQSPETANPEQVLDLAGGIGRHRHETRLVELGLADRQRALRRVVVSDGQPRQLPASQPRGGQQLDREAHVLGTHWRGGGAGQRAGGGQQLDDLAVGEDMRPDGLVGWRKQPLVGDEAAGLAAPSIQAQVRTTRMRPRRVPVARCCRVRHQAANVSATRSTRRAARNAAPVAADGATVDTELPDGQVPLEIAAGARLPRLCSRSIVAPSPPTLDVANVGGRAACHRSVT